MNKNKTVLLLYPHLLKKGLPVWELLNITKVNNIPVYKTEPVHTTAIRRYFSRLPESFASTLNRFTEKQLAEIKQEIAAADPALFTNSFERSLHQYFMALKPLLPLVPCYHQVPSTENKNRFKTAPCQFSSYTPVLHFQVRRSDERFFYLDTEVEVNNSRYPLSSFSQTAFLLEHRNEYFILRYTDYKTLCWLTEINWKTEAADAGSFTSNILHRLEQEYTVSRNGLLTTDVIEAVPEGQVTLSELNNRFLMLTPRFTYDGFIAEGPFSDTFTVREHGKEYLVNRNKERENNIIQQVTQLHENFSRQHNGYYYLTFEEAQKKNWFLEAFRHLLELEIQVLGMDMLRHFRYCAEKPVTGLQVMKEEGNWVYIHFTLHFGKEEVKFTELQKIMRNGQQAILLKDGSIALPGEDWANRYGLIVKHALTDKNTIRIPRWLAVALENSTDAEKALPPLLKQEWRSKWLQWQQHETTIYPLPPAISATLRLYQQKGYEWMRLLDELGAGIFLADDMGLGKTLQAICFAAHVLQQNNSKQLLIICPASLLYNWQNELGRFAPSVKKYVYHGTDRNKAVFSDASVQIIISSYGTLRSDESLFLAHSYSAVILDESHTIKNPASQIARLAHSLAADRRIVLSGTPVMNNTFDLFSQLQFILPGMFGSREFFKREYADPIDRDNNEHRIKDLQKLTAPFILRRTKEQVAGDLPPKTEITLWCRMEEEQQQVYNEIKEQIKGRLHQAIKENGLQKSKLQVLQGILKLRQVCNSPALLNDPGYPCTASIKTSELMEEIENNLSNHKALVFSQFTSMLDILSGELKKRNIPFLLLTGSTPAKERNRLVEEFNHAESNCRVFLLSLKAGNAGLNLTAADYVFLFDPWWNSAVEQQAIDRTHRIGQTKNVFAYKMICKDSIEERIVQLQQQKKTLAGELVQEDDGFVKALTEDDIAFLFE